MSAKSWAEEPEAGGEEAEAGNQFTRPRRSKPSRVSPSQTPTLAWACRALPGLTRVQPHVLCCSSDPPTPRLFPPSRTIFPMGHGAPLPPPAGLFQGHLRSETPQTALFTPHAHTLRDLIPPNPHISF